MQLFDQLLQFPLFQGMSRDDLAQVAGHTKFGFQKYGDAQCVVKEDEPCSSLCFLLSGTIQATTWSDDRGYHVVESLSAPYLLQPESIFGYNQRYTHTFTTLTECSFITVDKSEVMRLSEGFLVFRLNLLNIYATQTQKQLHQPWRRYPDTLADRIVRFLCQHCLTLSGPKVFHILMMRLAKEVGDSRLDVSCALNHLQHDGLIILRRGRIEVPQMERLLGVRG